MSAEPYTLDWASEHARLLSRRVSGVVVVISLPERGYAPFYGMPSEITGRLARVQSQGKFEIVARYRKGKPEDHNDKKDSLWIRIQYSIRRTLRYYRKDTRCE